MARTVALLGAVVVLVTGSVDAFAQDDPDMGGTPVQTGVDGTGQGSDASANVGPDLTEDGVPAQQFSVWDRLADCESSGRWHIVGATYSGGLQFDRPTWLEYGGGAYAALAAGATREQQIIVAERLRAVRGYQPWPVCSRVVGLR